ncbi:receptor-like serine/threonine-protein kinase SD1-8 isoform X1 [Tasmannia lanceolata]|uniref:receptor-like serine/threonine-protein kinase SD1-8 isoform X1 n=2 Tax=Tasmannia lanceolata TaxID=3420 RepID=UPI0040635FEF
MRKIPGRPCVLIFFLALFSSFLKISISDDTITQTQSISGNKTLISAGESFELGFFNPGNSVNLYLGIWYKKISVRTVVWVANRENPLTDTFGVLKIGEQGSLVILNGSDGVVWSSNKTKAINPVVQLLDSGNLVLREEGDNENFLWQSFDYPSDTMLPGMKVGWNLKTGLDKFLTSWKSADDPSPGDYSFRIDPNGLPEPFLWHQSTRIYRSGPWNGNQFSGVPEMRPNYFFKFEFSYNQDEIYYRFEPIDSSVVGRLMVNHSGQLQRHTWIGGNGGNGFWNLFWWAPKDQCDGFSECGSYGICNADDSFVCGCVKGFEPKFPQLWYMRDGSGGCDRKTPLDCKKGDGFLRLKGVKLPDTSQSIVDKNMTLKECEDECLKDCSCMAYASADIRGGGSGCVTWGDNVNDLRQFSDGGQDLYVRLASSELGNGDKKRMAIIVTATVVPVMLLLGLIGYCVWRKKRKNAAKKKGNTEKSQEILLVDVVGSKSRNKDKDDESRKEDLELPSFDLGIVAIATDNFSVANKLGEGGFGPVYKGKLADGRQIAVKRLSKKSEQGLDEFKNEVLLIAKLQHRNLVRLLGCCIEGEEKMLIYEYMQNGSLDSIIFDEAKTTLLYWHTRFNIIMGIARGLLYLHQDSRFRIIHRDLKASNILLDSKMNPKISDFGTARIFGGDQIEANTKRVVGTYGYMAPEYAMDGHFSEKSDVFSFGVLVLEIVSGKKNRGFFHAEEDLNLLGHVWRLWNEGKSLEFIDLSMGFSCLMSEVLRCIQVGLLCVQERAGDRPAMSSVVLMLSSENSSTLPKPKPPGFCAGTNLPESISSSNGIQSWSVNDVTVTTLNGR